MLRIAAILVLLAQSPELRVEGRVETEARHRGGRVTLEAPDGRSLHRARVGPDGEFDFGDVEVGSYWITLELPGFRELRRSLQVRSSLADGEGRILVTLALPAEARDEADYTVSVRDLEIPDEAIRAFERAMEAEDDVEEMRRRLDRAIELAPDFEQALNNLGTTYHREGDFARSIELFEQALAASPASFIARVNLGGSLLSDGQLDRAVVENQRALDLRPDDSLANAQMASSLFFLGRDAEAILYFERLKQLDPFALHLPEIYLSELYLRRGDPDRAVSELEAFLRKLPDHPLASEVRERLDHLAAGAPAPR